jgi:hypothetical protein
MGFFLYTGVTVKLKKLGQTANFNGTTHCAVNFCLKFTWQLPFLFGKYEDYEFLFWPLKTLHCKGFDLRTTGKHSRLKSRSWRQLYVYVRQNCVIIHWVKEICVDAVNKWASSVWFQRTTKFALSSSSEHRQDKLVVDLNVYLRTAVQPVRA